MRKLAMFLTATIIFATTSTVNAAILEVHEALFEGNRTVFADYHSYVDQQLDGTLPGQVFLQDGYLNGSLGGTGWLVKTDIFETTNPIGVSFSMTDNNGSYLYYNDININTTSYFSEYGGYRWWMLDAIWSSGDVSEISELAIEMSYLGQPIAYDTITRESNAVPIPSTILLLGSGIMGVIGIRRKRK